VTSPIYTIYTALLGKSVPQGAATHVFLAASPDVKGVSGKYFVDCTEEGYVVRGGRGHGGWGAAGLRGLRQGTKF
jgi:hypothetical protein